MNHSENPTTNPATMADANRPGPYTPRTPPAPPRVTQMKIGRTWFREGSYGNARLDFTIDVPEGNDVAEVIANATHAIEMMNPTDSFQESGEMWERIEELRAKPLEDFDEFVDIESARANRARKLAELEALLADEIVREDRRADGAEAMNNLICLAARVSRE